MEKTKDIAIVENSNLLSTFQSADLILQTVLKSNNNDLEKLEKLLEIKGKYENEENKKIFQREFAKMQAELPIIQKTKKVYTNSNKLMYSYAPLEKIIEQIKPILQKYGFSYRWTESITENKGYKRVWCHIMAYGHEEKSFFDIPLSQGNSFINSAQQAGSASTYGKRYSLIGALGIMADEDDDGNSLQNNSFVENTQNNGRQEKIRLCNEILKLQKEHKFNLTFEEKNILNNAKNESLEIIKQIHSGIMKGISENKEPVENKSEIKQETKEQMDFPELDKTDNEDVPFEPESENDPLDGTMN